MLSDFGNIFRKSFFVNVYTYLETSLLDRCRILQDRNKSQLSVSDIAGQGINQAITYIIKVHHIQLSLETNQYWSKIQDYRRLRNCIVHNNGKLDERADQRKALLAYIRRTVSLEYIESSNEIILSNDFCKEAIDTIARFIFTIDKEIGIYM